MIGPQFPEETPATVPDSTLRQFAGLCLAIFGGLFAWSWYRHGGAPTAAAWVGLAFALIVGPIGLIRPAAIRPVFLAIMAVTLPIGHVISTVLMGLIYFVVLTPLSLLFRLSGRDALARRLQPAADNYWTPKSQPTDVRRYLRQYQARRIAPSGPLKDPDHGRARTGA